MITAARTYSADSAHWYSAKGEPCYELPKKDGSGMKVPTLADARKLNLLPSVTTILKVLDKPALNDWKVEQGVLAVLTTPRQPGEADDAFVHRVLHVEEVQRQEAEIARDKGTEIHAAMESFFSNGGNWTAESDRLRGWIEPAAMAILRLGSDFETERCVVGRGFAGKTDLVQGSANGRIVWDYKTTKKLPPKGAWTEHVLQLSAYAQAIQEADAQDDSRPIDTANIYISTVEMGKFVIWEHTDNWQETFDRGFAPLVQYWQWVNSYQPTQ